MVDAREVVGKIISEKQIEENDIKSLDRGGKFEGKMLELNLAAAVKRRQGIEHKKQKSVRGPCSMR